MIPRSGTRFSIVDGRSRAEVAGIGATLRALALDGVDVLDGFDVDHLAPGGAGQVLAPWPNRLGNGQYVFNDTPANVPWNEPELTNAIHGLVRWHEWTPTTVGDAAVTLETALVPSPAYPWRLRLEITYGLSGDVLTVTFAAHNEDDLPVPFAIGFHPYFLAEGGLVDAASVSFDAAQHLVLDDRALPRGSEPLASTPFAAISSTEGLPLAGVVLDDCFTGLARLADGSAVARYLPGPGRRPVILTLGPSFTHLMCFTGDTLSPPRRRRAMAFEPMTCPPNAFATGDGVKTVSPGETFRDGFALSLG